MSESAWETTTTVSTHQVLDEADVLVAAAVATAGDHELHGEQSLGVDAHGRLAGDGQRLECGQ